jgi:hypothetical protein
MRWLLIPLLIALAPSVSAAPGGAEKVDPLDSCTIARAELEFELSKLRRELAVMQVRAKYKLTDADTVDPTTLAITRGKKAEPAKTAEARKQ